MNPYKLPESSINNYVYINNPQPNQPLQLLYPGKFMEGDYYFDREKLAFQNENYEGLKKTLHISKALEKAYNLEQEALERHLGGKHKIVNHVAVEPEEILDNPALRSGAIADNLDIVGFPRNSSQPFDNSNQPKKKFVPLQ